MAVSFVARKCTQCAGRLQYIKEKKIWQCLYCGAEIEREEQYDGLFTIKNVVRQSLLDTAYRRLDSAQKNLVECEKIDSRYIGTLIAKIAFEMISVITPGACDDRDVRNIFSQLKKNYEQLREISTTVTEEEEALYEFLEESDIFATLLLVYDSLNDTARRDYVLQLVDAKEIYSKYANSNLLSYSLKNGNTELADAVIANTDNLDVHIAIGEILNKYPDNEQKGGNAAKLLATGHLKDDGKPVIENYLNSSDDSATTKALILISTLDSGIRIGVEMIINTVLCKADAEQTKSVLSCVCKSNLNDEETLRILSFAFDCGKIDVAMAALTCLKDTNQYVIVPAKYLTALLSESRYSTQEKITLLKTAFEFKLENKAFESVVATYLCHNTDDPTVRKDILACLFDKAVTFPTATVETYVLKCDADGSEKPNIISQMFDKGLNTSFFNDLLSKYMNSDIDTSEVRAEVIDVLSKIGLRIDPQSFVDYICESDDEVQYKIKFINKMLSNGAQMRSDAANLYLEKTEAEEFSSELFALVFTPASSFSAIAIENYLLDFKDRAAIKAQNFKTLLELSSCVAANITCQVSHLGNDITCNLLQAYLLITDDELATAFEIADELVSRQKIKINEEMNVSGSVMKLKKYVVANKGSLGSTTNAICEKYKVYSMLF
ncbi:MAG: hypothetical protein IJA60_05645 [Clostridia bacterium]|nr:hypothetical protein [Clostridia bacterium]